MPRSKITHIKGDLDGEYMLDLIPKGKIRQLLRETNALPIPLHHVPTDEIHRVLRWLYKEYADVDEVRRKERVRYHLKKFHRTHRTPAKVSATIYFSEIHAIHYTLDIDQCYHKVYK